MTAACGLRFFIGQTVWVSQARSLGAKSLGWHIKNVCSWFSQSTANGEAKVAADDWRRSWARPHERERRKCTLRYQGLDTQLSQETYVRLQHITTVLCGIEPLIANKDVNGLSNEDSGELLLKGLALEQL